MTTRFTTPEPGSEPVPGYRLDKRLGEGGYGQVWRATAPGGFQIALKFVKLQENCGAVELRALELIRGVRHPNLLVTFACWQIEGWLIIAMELADCTLMDRFKEARDQGHLGIPRGELLDYFQEAARGIDYLNEPRHATPDAQRVAIQHRDIKPQNILLVGNGVKVADFGLARIMTCADASHSGGMTPAYAAPEFFKGHTSSSSDQYCLAVTYCKMRGGVMPFDGTLPEVMNGHLSNPPDLAMLPIAEQPIVARALSKDPKERWPSCRAFVEGLLACEDAPPEKEPDSDTDPELPTTGPYDPVPVTVPSSHLPGSLAEMPTPSAPPAPVIAPPPAPAVPPPIPAPAPPSLAALSPATTPRVAFEPPRENVRATKRTWLIGRDAGCDVVVNQHSVSAQHCRLDETDAGYFLEDLGSANGTFVNGYRITAPAHVVATDQITLGKAVPLPWPASKKSAADGQTLYVGRDPENDIVLDYATVSNRHARIVVRGNGATIEDLGSMNGIAIGHPNAKIKQASLRPDDVVYFGSLAVPASQLLQPGKGPARTPSATITFRGTPLVIGRDAGSDLVLDHAPISSRHAQLWREGRRIMIEDLGSTNGTFVNGKRVHLNAEVRAGDTIRLGSMSFKLEVL